MTDATSADTSGAVTGGVRTLLRLEGLALFIGMTLLYYIWDGDWWVYTIAGMQPLDLNEPVCHVSFYETDAFAHWAGERLATEFRHLRSAMS